VLLSKYVCCACAAAAGDRQEAAVKVAAAVGIAPSDVHAGIKPAGKAALVEQLKASGRKVAMVGDGINDTAALAAADVGMAMAGGVDAASDVAKVVLMGDQLHQVGVRPQGTCITVAIDTAASVARGSRTTAGRFLGRLL
jgi:P-type E1-E2 ATPase